MWLELGCAAGWASEMGREQEGSETEAPSRGSHCCSPTSTATDCWWSEEKPVYSLAVEVIFTTFPPYFASAQAFLVSEQFWEAKITDEFICFVSGSFRFILGVQHSRVTSWTAVNLGSSMSLGEQLNPSRSVCLAKHWQNRLPKLWPERRCY
jgi:hypothetical protein